MDVKDIVPFEEQLGLFSIGYPSSKDVVLFSTVFRWFRKKHLLVHKINSYVEKWGIVYDYEVFSLVLPKDDVLGEEGVEYEEDDKQTWETLVEKDLSHTESISYEGAELECLRWLIKYVKEREA